MEARPSFSETRERTWFLGILFDLPILKMCYCAEFHKWSEPENLFSWQWTGSVSSNCKRQTKPTGNIGISVDLAYEEVTGEVWTTGEASFNIWNEIKTLECLSKAKLYFLSTF